MADERDDVVRVMTVHQAKGLEFPVVFVPACGAMEQVDGAQNRLRRGPRAGGGSSCATSASQSSASTRRPRGRIAELRKRAPACRVAARLLRRGHAGCAISSSSRASGSRTIDRIRLPGGLHLDGLRRRRAQRGRSCASSTATRCRRRRCPSRRPRGRCRERRVHRGARGSAAGRRWSRPPPRPGNVTVAVTQLADFQLCPRRYQQFHALGLQEHPASSRARRPTSLVDVDDERRRRSIRCAAARWPIGCSSARRSAAAAPITRAAQSAAVPTATIRGSGGRRGARPRGGVPRHAFARGLDGVGGAARAAVPLGGALGGGVLYLRGQMDLRVLSASGVTVVDYKHARRGEPDDYRFQLDAYALAARRLYRRRPRCGRARVPQGGRPVARHCDGARRRRRSRPSSSRSAAARRGAGRRRLGEAAARHLPPLALRLHLPLLSGGALRCARVSSPCSSSPPPWRAPTRSPRRPRSCAAGRAVATAEG